MCSSGSLSLRSLAGSPAGRGLLAAGVLLLLVGPAPLLAGGPLELTARGQPLRWTAARPLRYWVDAGPLGSRSQAQAVGIIAAAFDTWRAASSAPPPIERSGLTARDITGRNVLDYLERVMNFGGRIAGYDPQELPQ